jgi:hypothetical protein
MELKLFTWDTYEVYVIVIVDHRQVFWEVFKSDAIVKDVWKRMKQKHNIILKSGMINSLFTVDKKTMKTYISHYCDEIRAVSMKVYTK